AFDHCLLINTEMHMWKSVASTILVTTTMGMGMGMVQPVVRGQADQAALGPGPPVVRKLAGGETHSYQVALAAGGMVLVTVEQQEIDVVVSLLTEGGEKLFEIDDGQRGLEQVLIVADKAASYRVEIRAAKKRALAGGYAVRIAERREATPKDQDRFTAEILLNQGKRWQGED